MANAMIHATRALIIYGVQPLRSGASIASNAVATVAVELSGIRNVPDVRIAKGQPLSYLLLSLASRSQGRT